jgi:hypothetical protein
MTEPAFYRSLQFQGSIHTAGARHFVVRQLVVDQSQLWRGDRATRVLPGTSESESGIDLAVSVAE